MDQNDRSDSMFLVNSDLAPNKTATAGQTVRYRCGALLARRFCPGGSVRWLAALAAHAAQAATWLGALQRAAHVCSLHCAVGDCQARRVHPRPFPALGPRLLPGCSAPPPRRCA